MDLYRYEGHPCPATSFPIKCISMPVCASHGIRGLSISTVLNSDTNVHWRLSWVPAVWRTVGCIWGQLGTLQTLLWGRALPHACQINNHSKASLMIRTWFTPGMASIWSHLKWSVFQGIALLTDWAPRATRSTLQFCSEFVLIVLCVGEKSWCLKSASIIGLGRGGTSFLTDFDETWPVQRVPPKNV